MPEFYSICIKRKTDILVFTPQVCLRYKNLKLRKDFVLVLTFAVLLVTCIFGFSFPRITVLNVSAVQTVDDIGVYWDESCSMRVFSIDWGVLSLNSFKRVVVYVRNEGNESFLLVLRPVNWNPYNASRYLDFSWSCEISLIEAGQVVKVVQGLHVSPNMRGVSNFSFDIIFETRRHFLGDTNKDGVVDILDISVVCMSFGSRSTDSNWNPDADLNKDCVVDIFDVASVLADYGKTWEP